MRDTGLRRLDVLKSERVNQLRPSLFAYSQRSEDRVTRAPRRPPQGECSENASEAKNERYDLGSREAKSD